MVQVREAIGLNLSVLSSNIRLYESTAANHSLEEETNNLYSRLKAQSWAQLLVERASELALRIQTASHSDSLETSTAMGLENGFLDSSSQDDIKQMETVIHFLLYIFYRSSQKVASSVHELIMYLHHKN